IANLIAIANFVEQHFGLFEDSLVVNRYLNIVSTIGVLASNFQKPQAIELARQKLEQFAQARKEAEVLVFERIEELNILHVRDWSDFSAADEVIERILKGLVYYGERVNRRRRIFFMLAICEIYLLTNRPAATAKLLATLVHDSPLESGPRANILLWSYYLIAEYELGHQDIMKQWAKTAARYVKEFAIDDQPGIALIHFLRELSRKSDPGKRKTVFRRFASEVAPMLEVPPNQFYENRFPFTKWVQCQLTEVAFPPK
ncbi:MAG TPA: hypothetical protein VHS96_00480, partial [Bacteroidia bacterium]|nr:hypothetical protein [Bacteroidia bacterium]